MTVPLVDTETMIAKLPGATAATRFAGGTVAGAPTSGTFLKGDFVIDQTGVVWICTTAGSPGTWNQAGTGLGGPPTGVAGGSLAGNYPNPSLANNSVGAGTIQTSTITDTHVVAANKDGAANKASMRTLGNGALQAVAGNDARFTQALNGAVTGSLPGPLALAANSVTGVQLATGSVGAGALANGAVALNHMATGSVDATKIVDGTITKTEMSSFEIIGQGTGTVGLPNGGGITVAAVGPWTPPTGTTWVEVVASGNVQIGGGAFFNNSLICGGQQINFGQFSGWSNQSVYLRWFFNLSGSMSASWFASVGGGGGSGNVDHPTISIRAVML